ncbi:hypothetical protein [Seongchinamella unica]|uniref:hypothetical protein n=1 Tax=Seongchinamella unica TaxID=2547392 RepID=UPI001EEE1E9B|nr:hypothetical protein [Seongchinamella unica]
MTSAPEWRLLGMTVLLALLAGCGPTTVKVQGSFPEPLMEPVPLTLGVWYTKDFANHEFFDEAKSRSESGWVVNTGEAQVAMWDTLLAGMFSRLVHMKGKPAPGQMNQVVNAVLIPHVDELQYAIPQHTNVKVYEIWMRYRFELVTNAGKPIAEWTMPAYGKTPTAFLRSDEAAVNLAAVMALRDAGANFATSFTRVPAVAEWLDGRQVGKVPAVARDMPAEVGADSDTVAVPVIVNGDPSAGQAVEEIKEVE